MNEPIRLGVPVGYVDVHLRHVRPVNESHGYIGGRFVVDITGDVAATTTGIFFAGDTLGRFLTGLADDFRGWTGQRVWRSPDTELHVAATHDKLGHIHLAWTLTDGQLDPGWKLTTATTVDAGEDMQRLAADVRAAEPNN
ncbi:DUF6228 family protein [Phytomonospora sp. NPDC050363]|uniref:DUF6228 family protein n=1 Tax=Phytomonospora sp. NPDC050363 TaxID=3155642 RepID=UPI0033E1FB89